MSIQPGPYRLENKAVKAVSHGQWFTVARVDPNGKFTPAGVEKMGAMFAAAPDMLEALRMLVDCAECENGIVTEACVLQARAAIAKATGGAQS